MAKPVITDRPILDQASFDGITIWKKEGNSIEVSDDSYDSVKAALKDIATRSGFSYDEKWTSQQFGSKLIAFLKSNGAVDGKTNEEKIVHDHTSDTIHEAMASICKTRALSLSSKTILDPLKLNERILQDCPVSNEVITEIINKYYDLLEENSALKQTANELKDKACVSAKKDTTSRYNQELKKISQELSAQRNAKLKQTILMANSTAAKAITRAEFMSTPKFNVDPEAVEEEFWIRFDQLKNDQTELISLRKNHTSLLESAQEMLDSYNRLKESHSNLQENAKDLIADYKRLETEHDKLRDKYNELIDRYNDAASRYNDLIDRNNERPAKKTSTADKDPEVRVRFIFKIKGFLGWNRESKVITMRQSEFKALQRGSDKNKKNYIINHSSKFDLSFVQSLNVEALDQVSVELYD